MPANPYSENDSYSELWPFGEKTEGNNPLETSWHKNSPSWYQGRRRKAALVLVAVWSGTFALHWFSWGTLLVLGLTGVIAIHAVRVLGAKPRNTPEFLSEETRNEWPYVSLLVAAKNEEAVIERLVETLCNLDYPEDRCELWVIDDYSTDKTPEILDRLAEKYKQLRVFHRAPNAGGGKSGALNQVLPLTKGEFLAVFDADASVQPDVLRRVLPIFARLQVGAVQMRKAIANSSVNFWTKGQEAEMALDSYFQQQRIAIGGIGELRGNGRFIRRSALQGCGGFNEETITDDLDLTVRLHLEGWDIEFVMVPVQEEGVTNALALWHQRNRWAEGGYQRYLDYWSLIVSNRMGFRKTWDMFIFWIIQYFLPMATVPDSLIAIAFKRMPIYSPITALMLGISFFAMSSGLRRIRANENLPPSPPFFIFWQTLRGIFYMFHWIIVMASVTARMAVRPKRLKWVKTVHTG